jgi:hypothetical protein
MSPHTDPQLPMDDPHQQDPATAFNPKPGTGAESITSLGKAQERYAYAPESLDKQQNAELEPSYEKIKPQETTAQADLEEQTGPLLTKLEQPQPTIVDKSAELTKIHHISQSHDKLTNRADTEEEEFIEKVESIHDHR